MNRQKRVWVDFQFLEPHEPVSATLVEGGWHPATPDRAGDVAVLQLVGDLPAGALPAPLREAHEVGDHRFRAYGYPRGHEQDGVWSRGVIVGAGAGEWLQLEAASDRGYALRRGFSGGPLWDEDLGAVVGVIVASDRDEPTRTGFGIPVEVLTRYWPRLALWVGWRLSHDPAMQSHWSPRARGVERDSRPGWYFTGRRRALRELVEWMEGPPADGRVRVVTGGPGSGKSALLGRLVASTDPQIRARMQREDPTFPVDPDALPDWGRVLVAVHARGLGQVDVVRRIADAVSWRIDDPSILVQRLAQHHRPRVVVVDALDEAVSAREARAVASKVLAPLARDAATVGIKVLVGCRRGRSGSLLRLLGADRIEIDLDDPAYFDLADLTEYATRSLRLDADPARRSPYRDNPEAIAQVARAIAEQASPSFLVAGLAARARADDDTVIDVAAPGWRDQQDFPDTVDAAMRDYLDRLEDPQRAFELLVPVAFARPPGMPVNDLWMGLANAYSNHGYGLADLDWLVDTAAADLLESANDDEPRVRLFHQALIDHIRARTQARLVEATISRELAQRARARGGWPYAEPYARSHAASHAAAAVEGMLDEFLADPMFLLAAHQPGLLRALPAARSDEARLTGRAYEYASAWLLTAPAGERAAYLQLAARLVGADHLAERIGDHPEFALPWRTHWAASRVTGSRGLGGHSGRVEAVAVGEVNGDPVAVSGGEDGSLRIWDLVAGHAVGDPLRGHQGAVVAVAVSEVGDRPVAVSGGEDATIRVWALDTGEALSEPLQGHTDRVWAVAVTSIQGSPVAVSGGHDGTIRSWDLTTMQARAAPMHGHDGAVLGLAICEVEGRPVVVTSGEDSTVRVWDLGGQGRMQTLRGHRGEVSAVAVARVGGRPVAVTGGEDGMRMWDLTGDEAHGRPLSYHEGTVTAVAVGDVHGEPCAVSGSADASLRMWDLATWAPASGPLLGHQGWVVDLAVAQVEGRPVAVSAADDGFVRTWDLEVLRSLSYIERRHHHGGVSAVDIGRVGGRLVAVSGGGDATVRVWDMATGEGGEQLLGHDESVTAVAVTTIGGAPVAVSSGVDGTLRVWDLTTKQTRERPLQAHEDEVWAVATGKLGDRPVAVSGGYDGTIRVWDLTTMQAVGEPLDAHPEGVLTLAWGYAQAGAFVVSGGFDGTIRVWDLATMDPWGQPLEHDGRVWVVTLAEVSGRPVALASGDDPTIRMWDLAAMKAVRPELHGHNGPVGALATRQVDNYWIAVSGGRDGRLCVWDLAAGTLHSSLETSSPIHDLAVTWDGQVCLATGHGLIALDIRPSTLGARRSYSHGG